MEKKTDGIFIVDTETYLFGAQAFSQCMVIFLVGVNSLVVKHSPFKQEVWLV